MLRFRRFHLAVLVVAGLFVSAGTGRALDPRLLPANTEIVVTLNIKQMLDSELVKSKKDVIDQIKAAMDNPAANDAMKYLKQMGFDPLTHLTSLSIAHPGSQDPKEVFIVIDGVFDAKKFADTAVAAAKDFPGTMKISKFGATPFYEIQVPGPVGNETLFLALVAGKSIVVTADAKLLEGAITRSTGTTVAATKVKDLLKATNDKQSFSFAITGEAMTRLMANAPGAGNIPQIGDALKSITGLTAAVTITKEINFQLGIGTADAKAAREIADAGDAGLALLKLMVAGKAKQDPNLAPLVEVVRTLRISAVGPNAVLTGSITEENLTKLLKSLGNKFKGGL